MKLACKLLGHASWFGYSCRRCRQPLKPVEWGRTYYWDGEWRPYGLTAGSAQLTAKGKQ